MATFLITDSDNGITNNNFHYLLGFQPSLGGIAIRKESIHIFLDSRYYAKTKKINKDLITEKTKISDIYFHKVSGPLVDIMLLTCKSSKNIELEENLTLKYFHEINNKSDLGTSGDPKKTSVIPNYFEKNRLVKSDPEIKKMKKAIEVIDKVSMFIQYLVDTHEIYGKTESEVRNIIVNKILEFGGEDESFEAIVAFGVHSSVPHHTAGDTIIEDGPLLIDMGAKYKGYCSDFTRTFWVGKKTDDYDEFQKVYRSVKKASIKATLGARVGMKASQIDALARKSIIKDGYGEYFSHSTGHGVGLNIHEGPWITKMSHDVIKTGMMFTIEPGIYLPGKFGIRIENIVVAKEERVKCVSKIRY
ncbi:MAG: M24 family metallopeptidase [Candidatus Gracilibacteria bacterium]|nr:M24 family metallopeptidase [Candidatus Gracilibacteria bacterium]